MLLGRVVGTVVPCVVCDGLAGVPMLFVQPLDQRGEPRGAPLVAADATRMAGPGERVYYEGGREAALALEPWFVPVDHTIVGIVDTHDVEGREAPDEEPMASGRRAAGSARRPPAGRGGKERR